MRRGWEIKPPQGPARAVWPDPATKGHSRSGLIRVGSRAATPGAFRARAQSGPCGGRGQVLPSL